MSRPNELMVVAIIIDGSVTGPRVLLTNLVDGPYAGQWCLPYRYVGSEESWLEMIRREIERKTNVEFRLKYFRSFEAKTPECQTEVAIKAFCGDLIGDPTAEDSGIGQVRWFALEQALELPLAFCHGEILKAYEDQNKAPERREELLAEFVALRAEAVQRIDLRQQALNLAITGAGIFIGFAAGDVADPVVLLLFPWLALPIALMWAHHDVRLGQLSREIKSGTRLSLAYLG